MSVRFKFKNDLDYQPIPCDGFHISVRDLKKSIIRLKKFGKITDFDLVVTNSQSLHVYLDDEELISKNTTLTVQRAPLGEGKKKVVENITFSKTCHPLKDSYPIVDWTLMIIQASLFQEYTPVHLLSWYNQLADPDTGQL